MYISINTSPECADHVCVGVILCWGSGVATPTPGKRADDTNTEAEKGNILRFALRFAFRVLRFALRFAFRFVFAFCALKGGRGGRGIRPRVCALAREDDRVLYCQP